MHGVRYVQVFRQVIRMLNPEVRRVLLRARMLQAVATAPVEEVPLNNIRSLVNHIQALPEEQIPQPRDPPAAEVPEAVPAVDEKNSSPPEEGENGEEDQETD